MNDYLSKDVYDAEKAICKFANGKSFISPLHLLHETSCIFNFDEDVLRVAIQEIKRKGLIKFLKNNHSAYSSDNVMSTPSEGSQ